MTNSLLLHEGTGIGYARRQEIVDQAYEDWVTPNAALGTQYGPKQAMADIDDWELANDPARLSQFDVAALDFSSRILPEIHQDIDVESKEFMKHMDITARFDFIRGVASVVHLSKGEVTICAELLNVRQVLLAPSTTVQKSSKQKEAVSWFLGKRHWLFPVDIKQELATKDTVLHGSLAV